MFNQNILMCNRLNKFLISCYELFIMHYSYFFSANTQHCLNNVEAVLPEAVFFYTGSMKIDKNKRPGKRYSSVMNISLHWEIIINN